MSSTAHPVSLGSFSAPSGRTVTRDVAAAGVPWYIWTGVLAITSAEVGAAWDVSWHRSIGRDSFWTPAHLMIQLCGILAAVVGLWLVYQCTFNRTSSLRASSVNVFGLRAPLGVFVAGWGGIAMLTSAPFDNWWHAAYGLDVKIVSPPHTLLALGIRAVSMGIFLLILAAMNRAAEDSAGSFSTLRMLLLYLGGLTVQGVMFFLQEFTQELRLHSAIAYISMGIAIPVVLAMISQASRFRWAATASVGIYSVFTVGQILILPLFHAEPKLGPVYFPVTHFVPAHFPPLIILPAIALDLLWARTRNWKLWQVALVSGLVFVGVLTAVEWPFANFLLSKASANRFFGTGYFGYDSRPDSFSRLRIYLQPDSHAALWLGLMRASIYAVISAWIGLVFGRWMRGVQR
jgi:hypothetical protein